jgi:hypothetical protein
VNGFRVAALHGWQLDATAKVPGGAIGSQEYRLTSRKIHDANEMEPKTPDSASCVVRGRAPSNMAAVGQ